MHAMKEYGGVKVCLSSFLTPTLDWRRVFSFTSRPLHPRRKRPHILFTRMFLGPRTSLDAVRGESSPLALPGIEPRLPVRQACSPVTVPTALPHLQDLEFMLYSVNTLNTFLADFTHNANNTNRL